MKKNHKKKRRGGHTNNSFMMRVIFCIVLVAGAVFAFYKGWIPGFFAPQELSQYPQEPVETPSVSAQTQQKEYSLKISGLKESITRSQSSDFSIQPLTMAQAQLTEGGNALTFTNKNFWAINAGKAGEPKVPGIEFRVLLPKGVHSDTVRLENVTATVSETQPLTAALEPQQVPLTYDENFEPVQADEDARDIAGGKKRKAYQVRGVFPPSIAQLRGVHKKGKFIFASVRVFPYQYDPTQNQLRLNSEIAFNLTFTTPNNSTLKSQSLKAEPQEVLNPREMEMSGTFINDEGVSDMVLGAQAPGAAKGYAIITTKAIVANSKKLNAFITAKQQRGFVVTVATETQWSNGSIPATKDRAVKIREWLQRNYVPLKLDYVLLVGDPRPYDPSNTGATTGDVPMQMCWPRLLSFRPNTYTDLFYAELTADWNANKDKYFCDGVAYPTGDNTGASVGYFDTEVSVGRIPIYSGRYSTLDTILQRTMDYEKDAGDTSWRKKAILPEANLDDIHRGWWFGEAIKTMLGNAGFQTFRLYQTPFDGAPASPDLPISYNNLQDTWNGTNGKFVSPQGAGLMIMSMHGSSLRTAIKTPSVISIMNESTRLDSTKPTFTFQASCSNSNPIETSNISYALLRNGVMGAVGATTNAFYLSKASNFCDLTSDSIYNEQMACRFAQYLSKDYSAGDALDLVKNDATVTDTYGWMNIMGYNLYGDPSISLGLLPGSSPPPTAAPSLVPATPTPVPSGSGPLAHWRLDETGGTRVDVSGHGLSLADRNTVLSQTGKFGRAANFEDANKEYLTSSNAAFNIPGSLTLVGWMRMESKGKYMIMASKNNYGNNTRSYRFNVMNTNKLQFAISTDGTFTDLVGPTVLSTNTWYHVAAVFNAQAKTMTIYLNSQVHASRAVTFSTLFQTSAPFMLGANMNGSNNSQFFDGLLDEWRVYNRPLSQAEIQAVMNTP